MRCLVAFIKADNFPEAMDFANYVTSLPGNPVKNKKKYLVLMTPVIKYSLLQNQTGNVAVHIISPNERGKRAESELCFLEQERSLTFFIILGDELSITSLCPTLGRKYSVVRPGICPSTLQNPNGKKLPVSMVGPFPFAIFNKKNKKELMGGAEFQIIDVYARKFNFTYEIAPKPNATRGMVGRVKLRTSYK